MTDSWPPDWKDESKYPLEDVPKKQWAWEFLRRNLDFQKAWNDFEKTGVKPDRNTLERKFAVIDICNYRAEFGSIKAALILQNAYTNVPFVAGWGIEHGAKQRFAIVLDVPEVLVKFNVLEDIESQVQEVAEKLKNYRNFLKTQKHYKDVVSPTSPHVGAFQTYLRLLDAEAQLAPISDSRLIKTVTPVIYRNLDEDSSQKRLKANLKQARSMRDTGFKTLALQRPLSKTQSKALHDEIDEAELARLNNIPEK